MTDIDIDAMRADLATRHRLMRTTTLSAASAAKQVIDMLVEEIPALLDEVDRLRAELDRLAEELESEGSTDQLDSAYRLREVLAGTYEFDAPVAGAR